MYLNVAITVVIAVVTVTPIYGLYDGDNSVVQLTPSNFPAKVLDSDSVWIVEFYAPWCGHCKSLAPEYKKAAKVLKGTGVRIGAVDADAHRELGGKYGVKGFPTIKIFGLDKNNPIDYNGPRTAQGFIDKGFQALRALVNGRLGGKSGKSGSSGGSGGGSSKDVIELTDETFRDKVLKSTDTWIVEFYAPWCGHCKNLAPIWAEAATKLKGSVKVGALDATVNTQTAQDYGIQGFPTIKLFPGGEDYQGARTVEAIVAWAEEKSEANAVPPTVEQLTSESQLKEACEASQLCIIAALPHIFDCQSECRNKYIADLQKVADKFKKHKWAYLWVEAGAQPDLESGLEIGGFGYPAMAVMNLRKSKYTILKGSFSVDGISEYLRDLSYGKGSSAALRGARLPAVTTTEPWDGKDLPLPTLDDDDSLGLDADVDSKDEL